MKVTKRDGRIVDYDRNKIVIAIQKANAEVDRYEQLTDDKIESIVAGNVEVLGPAGAPVVKVNNRYRYCVYLCGKGGSVLRRTVSEYLLAFYARKENRGLDIFADCNALQ